MSVSLTKGGKVNLSKELNNLGVSELSKVAVGLGWDCNDTGFGSNFDLDAWAMPVHNDGVKRKDFVYFGNKNALNSAVHHCGDNLTGEGDGDDETINIDLKRIPADYKGVLVGVTIYLGKERGQAFRDVNNSFIRVYDVRTNTEICKYADQFKRVYADCTTLLFGAFVRNGSDWEFVAIGRGSKISKITGCITAYKDYKLDNINNTNNNNGGKKPMAVSLSKGGKVSLAKAAADVGVTSLTSVVVGLGWDVNRYDGGADFDLDASAFMLGANGKVRNEKDFIFYNNLTGPGVTHMGDNRTGSGDGDDEQIKIDLNAVPADVDKIAFSVTIDQADTRNQNFGMVENSYIHILDEASGTELVRYDLGEDFSIENTIVVAELYRHNGEWKFNAVGSGFSGGLAAICNNFGVDVG